jgi:hypothetical protein
LFNPFPYVDIVEIMYQRLGFILSVSSLAGIASTSHIHARSDWVHAGCFAEPVIATALRLLPSKKGTSVTGLSLSPCARFCANYLIFGVENGTTVSFTCSVLNRTAY